MTATSISLSIADVITGDLVAQKRIYKYVLIGIVSPATALNYAVSNIPIYLTTEALFRQNITQTSEAVDLHYFDVEYGPVPRGAGTWRISFDTTGGTVRKKSSLACVNVFTHSAPGPAGVTKAANTHPTMIGERESDGEVEGADVVVPSEKRTYTYRWDKGVVTEPYMDYIAALTGVVNSTVWHGRPAGEVLFLGCKGDTAIPAAECDLAYDFAFAKNQTNQTADPDRTDYKITGVHWKGHEIVDFIFTPKEDDASKPGNIIDKIRIHRVYQELNFYTYLGF